jgi:hypothetical protein
MCRKPRTQESKDKLPCAQTISSSMAIVPAGNQGKIDTVAGNGMTNLILDISSYFAP